MNRRGDELKVLHPMRFIGHILSDPDSYSHLKTVKSDFFKYNSFISGFNNQIAEKANEEDLLLYSSGFARHVKIEHVVVTQAIESKKYRDLIEKTLKS